MSTRIHLLKTTLSELRWVVVYLAALVLVAGGLYSLVEDQATWGDGVWWAIATIPTLGYGDETPTSPLIRYGLTTGVVISGIVAIAILTSVILDHRIMARAHEVDETPHDIDDDFTKLGLDLDDAKERLNYLQHRYRRDEGADDKLCEAATRAVEMYRLGGAMDLSICVLEDAIKECHEHDA